MKAIIIDDIQEARENLKADLKAFCPEVEVIGEANGVVEGAKLIRNSEIDVAFLDIQMQDGSGFDLLEIIGEINFKVIFVTASDSYAIRAFRYAAIDYLLKPIDPDLLVDAVNRIEPTVKDEQARVQTLLENKSDKKPGRIALNTLEKIHICPVNEIVRLESSGNYTIFHFGDKRQLLVTRTLKEFDQLLQEHDFIRIHQSHLVNSDFIKEFVKSDGGYLVMTDGVAVPVSTRKKANLMDAFQKL